MEHGLVCSYVHWHWRRLIIGSVGEKCLGYFTIVLRNRDEEIAEWTVGVTIWEEKGNGVRKVNDVVAFRDVRNIGYFVYGIKEWRGLDIEIVNEVRIWRE
jgi:hypothetical protein